MLPTLLLLVACFSSPGLTCGEGTVEEDGLCVLEETASDADTGADTEANADTDADADTDGDADTEADTDTGTDVRWESVLVDFDDVAAGVDVEARYADDVRFSTESGFHFESYGLSGCGQSEPNFACTAYDTGGYSCRQDLFVDFMTPARGISIRALVTNDDGPVLTVRAILEDGDVQETDVQGSGDWDVPVTIDLAQWSDVVRLEFVDIVDQGGVGWDDLSFERRIP